VADDAPSIDSPRTPRLALGLPAGESLDVAAASTAAATAPTTDAQDSTPVSV
jgi:hypothetical protein